MLFLYLYSIIGLVVIGYMIAERKRLCFFKRLHAVKKEVEIYRQHIHAAS